MGRKLANILVGLTALVVLTIAFAAVFGAMQQARGQNPAMAPPIPGPLAAVTKVSTTTVPIAKPAPTPPEPRPAPGTPGPRLTPNPPSVPPTPPPELTPLSVRTIPVPGKEFGVYSPRQELVVSGPWGTATGEFGKQLTGARSGPSSFAVDTDGSIFLLDTVNARVQKYDPAGKYIAAFPVARGTEDLVVDEAGSLYAMDGYDTHRVRKYDPAGKLLQEIPISSGIKLIMPDAMAYKNGGLFVEAKGESRAVGPYVYQVLDKGVPIPADQQASRLVPGRPARSADAYLMKGASSATTPFVDVFRSDGVLERRIILPLERQIGALPALASDASGNVYLAVHLYAEETTPMPRVVASQIVLLVFDYLGVYKGKIEMPDGNLTEIHRKVVVTSHGDIYQLQTSDSGVRVVKWQLN